jgi:hypothetical protein
MNPFVLIVWNLTQYPEPLQSSSSALHVINGPATFALDSARSLFIAIETLMTILTTSHLQFDVMRWL